MKPIRLTGCLLFVLFTVWGCKPAPADEPIPASVISRDTMVQLLADLHIMESRLLLSGVGNQAVLPKTAAVERVLKQYDMDTTRLGESLNFYTDHPAIFEQLYGDVISEISKRQAAAAHK